MLQIKKISIGIRPSNKMFRVGSLAGTIADEVLGLRGKKPISDEYYKEVAQDSNQGYLRLRNQDEGNIFQIDLENIIFSKDYYDKERKCDLDKVIEEFRLVWKAANGILQVKNIRRIGIVAEYRVEVKKETPSMFLLKSLTNLTNSKHPAKFALTFEERHITKEGAMPDFKKDDFVNIIYSIYDSAADLDYPSENSYNINVDYQKLYSPLFSGNISDEIAKIKTQFNSCSSNFQAKLMERGLL